MAVVALTALYLSGCGSSSSNPAGTSLNPAGGASGGVVLSGTATKGPIDGATVTIYAVDPSTGARGTVLGSGTTDASGNFKITLGSAPAGPVAVVVTDGSYPSEIDSGTTVSDTSPMCAMVADLSTGLSGLSVTPLSDMVCSVASASAGSGTSTAAAIGSADTFVMGIYGLSSPPEKALPDFSSSGVGSGTDGGKVALVLAALDKLASDLVKAGTLDASTRDDIYAALSADIADGKFDGLSAGTVVPLGSGVLPFTAGSTDFIGALSAVPSSLFGGADLHAAVAAISPGIAAVAPASVGISATSSGAMSTLAFGGHQYLYVAARSKGVQKVDVTDPAHPVVLGPPDWQGAGLVSHFPSSGSVGGAQVITGLTAGPQLLVFSYGENHLALVDPDTGAVTYEGDLSLTNGEVFFSGGSAYIAGAIPVAGAGAWLATADGYEFLDANASIAGAAAPVITTTYPVSSLQELAENLGGDISPGYLLAPNYQGIQVVNVSRSSGIFPAVGSFTLDPTFTSTAELLDFDGGAVDSALGVAILTYEDTNDALFVDMNHLTTDAGVMTFTPAATNGLAHVTFSQNDFPAFSGSAVDPETHQALFMAGYSNDMAVAQVQSPASVAAGDSWAGVTDWAYYTLPSSSYAEAQDPHAVAVVNIGGKSYGYLLNGADNPVGLEQIDLSGFLAMPRLGASGDAAHKPASDPMASGGPITAISFPTP